MKIINLKDNIIIGLNKKNIIDNRESSNIYKIKDNLSLKTYKNMLEEVIRNKRVNTLLKEKSEELQRKLNLIEQKKENIKHFNIPTAILKVKNIIVGALYEGEYNNEFLYKYYTYDTEFMLTCFRYIVECNKELCDNYIYNTDYYPSNILINLNEDKIELVDIDSRKVYVEENRDSSLENESYSSIKSMILSYLLLKSSSNESFEESLLEEGISKEMIEILLDENSSYDELNVIIDYLINNEKVKELTINRKLKK